MLHILLVSSLLASVYGASINNKFQLDGRIVGGYAISISNAPYQASYEYNGRQVCGASVISTTFVVTAAHCTEGDPVSAVAIRVGTDQRGSGGSVHRASQIIEHARYSTFLSPRFDIALVKVATSFVYSASVRPVSLATALPAVGSAVVTSGWGTTSEGGTASTQLLQVQVNTIGEAACHSAYPFQITEQMFCAGVAQGGKDTCQGDSGGPLVYGSELVGIVSWGAGCARAGSPGVYTNVPVLREWVREHSGV